MAAIQDQPAPRCLILPDATCFCVFLLSMCCYRSCIPQETSRNSLKC
jgi:hypothetical protein